jgi:hypothetical protein
MPGQNFPANAFLSFVPWMSILGQPKSLALLLIHELNGPMICLVTSFSRHALKGLILVQAGMTQVAPLLDRRIIHSTLTPWLADWWTAL